MTAPRRAAHRRTHRPDLNWTVILASLIFAAAVLFLLAGSSEYIAQLEWS